MNTAVAWICARQWRQALLLVAVSAAIFLPKLGATGLSMSEGHRAIPAWEMLEDARASEAHWLVPRMFETAYLRKPPGMLWAIAGSTSLFGETEFAARIPSAVSAMLLGLAVWWFATRWFGSPWGLAAGLAQVLLPVTWPSARSAEIESLHMLTTGVACLVAIHMGVCRSRSVPGWAVAFGAALAAMLVTKGPAGVPFVFAAVLVMGVGRGTLKRLIALVIAASLSVSLTMGWVLRPFSEVTEPAVRQGVESFLWDTSKVLEIITIGPAMLLTMMPAALALLFPWGPDARRELDMERSGIGPLASPGDIARKLAWACVVSLAFLTVVGVSNARYGLPLCALVSMLVAYVARGAWVRDPECPAPMEDSGPELAPPDHKSGPGVSRPGVGGGFVGLRPAIARAMFLGRPWAWPVVLLIGGVVYVGVFEPKRRASSGRDAGIALAAALPDGAEVWADEMVEARPEVLYYAVREAGRQGRDVRVRWLKPSFLPAEQPGGLLLLLREDELVDEVSQYGGMPRFGSLEEIARGQVHKYTFVLVRAGVR